MLDIEKTLAQLSQKDKVLLLSGSDFWHTHEVKSLGIPRVRVSDGPNGVRGIRFFNGVASNCFPSATGLGATWDTDLLEEIGKQIGEECRIKGVHAWLGPTINIQRSPLGGRGFESYSEDPLLSGKLAASIIRGCQSKGVSATPKHYVCNDQELDRNSNSSEVSLRALREIYLKPFQIAIRESDPWALMTAYNRVNGLHVSENVEILQNILRKEWGWKGMTMSDWFGTYSTVEALQAGLDLEMPGPAIFRGTPMERALASGKVQLRDLDDSVRKVLELVNRAISAKIPFEKEEESLNDDATRDLLKRAAGESIVLLKNEEKMLPLPNKGIKKIAVIGPNAKAAYISGGGSAALKPYYTVSPLQGITDFANPLMASPEGEKGRMRMDCYAEDPDKNTTQKPVYSILADTTLAFLADGIPEEVPQPFHIRLHGTFTPDEDGEWQFGLAVAGQADLHLDEKVIIENSVDQTPGEAFFGTGTIEKKGKVSLTKGRKYNICLKWSNFKPVNPEDALIGRGAFRIGASPFVDPATAVAQAVDAAKSADVVVIVAGLSGDYESEGFDRPHMRLPPGVDDMISEVLKANSNSCIVVQSGTQCEMPWYSNAKSVLQAFYGGNEVGSGLASVLFGDHNPSAKLPLTFPLRLEDYPSHPFFPGVKGKSYYNEDVFVAYRSFISKSPPAPVLASFGYGLSYTTFAISDLKIGQVAIDADKGIINVEVEVKVTNTGDRAGGEVVQCYISPAKVPLPRPAMELAAFSKVHLKAGESRTVKLQLDRGAFSYFDLTRYGAEYPRGSWVAASGTYKVHVGNSLDRLPETGDVIVEKEIRWLGL